MFTSSDSSPDDNNYQSLIFLTLDGEPRIVRAEKLRCGEGQSLGFRGWGDAPWQLDKKVILMQWTGLKDKNGKEIWEGDCVKEVKPYGDFEHEIRWSKENGGFWVGTSCPLNAGEAEICEVIGNIYEQQ